jgi:hypothetical protein
MGTLFFERIEIDGSDVEPCGHATSMRGGKPSAGAFKSE